MLFVCPFLPYPLDDGQKIRAFNTIKQMLRIGSNVTVLCYGDKEDPNLREFGAQFNVETIVVQFRNPRGYFLIHTLPLFLSLDPYTVYYYRKREFKERLEALVTKGPFDVIYFYTPYTIHDAVRAVRLGKRVVVDIVDCHSMSMKRGFQSAKKTSHKLYWAINYLKWLRLERKELHLFDATIVSAVRDAPGLERILGDRLVVISHGVDTTYWQPMSSDRERYSMIFAGTMDAFANSTAIAWFVEEVFPSVKQRFPEARLYIAGKNPPESVKALGRYSGVKVLGYVEDLRELIGRSEIIICPLRMASGLQTKIIEGLAMNKPIVSTRIGLGDLESKLGSEDVVIADTREEFIRKLTELFSDIATLERVGRNGRRLIEREYGWGAFGDKLNSVLDKSTSKRLPPGSDGTRK